MEERVRTLATAALVVGLLATGAHSVGHLPALTADGSGAARDAAMLSYLDVLALLGSGLMVLVGLVLQRGPRPATGAAVLVVGAVMGVAAALDTVVVPVLVLLVVVLTLRRQARERV